MSTPAATASAAMVASVLAPSPEDFRAPPMSRLSLMTAPRKPSSPRSTSSIITFERVAGRPIGSSASAARWAVITRGQPASITARNGTRSVRSSSSRLSWTTGTTAWESSLVPPWPGKCLAHGTSPTFRHSSTYVFASSAARSGSVENARVAMMGLSGLR